MRGSTGSVAGSCEGVCHERPVSERAEPAGGRRPGHLPGRAGPAAGPGEGAHQGRGRDRRGATPPAHGRGRRQSGADRPRGAADPSRRVRGTPAAHRLLLHVARRPAGTRSVRGLHLGHHTGRGPVLPSLPRHHVRGPLPGPYDESVRYRDFMNWDLPWYSALASREVLLAGREVGLFHLVCYVRDGDRVFETYWTTRRGAEAMDYSYALMDLTVYGRQESWEDSPEGWPQQCSYTRTDGGPPDWPPIAAGSH